MCEYTNKRASNIKLPRIFFKAMAKVHSPIMAKKIKPERVGTYKKKINNNYVYFFSLFII